jgi:hypothetical protein
MNRFNSVLLAGLIASASVLAISQNADATTIGISRHNAQNGYTYRCNHDNYGHDHSHFRNYVSHRGSGRDRNYDTERGN